MQSACLVLVALVSGSPALSAGTASALFESRQALVFQIRVVDIASGDKAAIGSGFAVSAVGHLATNFHVIANYVHEPAKYRLEYVDRSGASGALELRAIDVIHDLAIVQADALAPAFLPLHEVRLAKGDRIYAMGNPHDLGMSIVEGTYNGDASISRYQKLLFSGSLNPGMSGGPAMTPAGRVMGVNVATGGDQLSFLVPVRFLATLLDTALAAQGEPDFTAAIRDDLLADQEAFYAQILQQATATEPFGDFRLPGRFSDAMKCWGRTVDDPDEERYVRIRRHCATEDEVYLDSDFVTGQLFQDYEWLTPGELNLLQFYAAVQSRFEHPRQYNVEDDKQVSPYHCENAFLRLAGHRWKVSTCQRAYRDYTGLFDLLFLAATVDMNDRALILRLGATGIGAGNAVALLRHFLAQVR